MDAVASGDLGQGMEGIKWTPVPAGVLSVWGRLDAGYGRVGREGVERVGRVYIGERTTRTCVGPSTHQRVCEGDASCVAVRRPDMEAAAHGKSGGGGGERPGRVTVQVSSHVLRAGGGGGCRQGRQGGEGLDTCRQCNTWLDSIVGGRAGIQGARHLEAAEAQAGQAGEREGCRRIRGDGGPPKTATAESGRDGGVSARVTTVQ
jgi:hypothetical protein